MSIERPQNLIEEGQRLSRTLLASANGNDKADGIIVDRLVMEAEALQKVSDLWAALEQRNCYHRTDLDGEAYIVCTCGEISKLLAQIRKAIRS